LDIVHDLNDNAILRDPPRMVRPLSFSSEKTETSPSSETLWTDELETMDSVQNFSHKCGNLCLSKQYTAEVASWASFGRRTLGANSKGAIL
jgi:hypothetical protein